MVGEKVVLHVMMKGSDGHYVGGLVNGARIVQIENEVAKKGEYWYDIKNIERLTVIFLKNYMAIVR